MSKKPYDDFLTNERGKYIAQAHVEQQPGVLLPSGVYEFRNSMAGPFFKTINTAHDGIIDLPNPAYEQVVGEFNKFLEPATRQAFKDFDFLYKRSTLLFGSHGTGKTIIVNKIANTIVQHGGIVIMDPEPDILVEAFRQIDSIQSDSLVCVVFEEIDNLIDEDYEDDLLKILDGEIQRENTLYLCTTNYIDKLPKRLLRPGRMSSVVEVDFPGIEARTVYLQHKLKDESEIAAFVDKTEGFSIDELSETVKAVKCLQLDINDVTERIKSTREVKKSPE